MFERSLLFKPLESSSVVFVFKNAGDRSVAKTANLLVACVVCEIFEKLVNRLFDHLQECNHFSDIKYGCRFSSSTEDLLTVVFEIARVFTGLGLLKLGPRGTPTVTLDISKRFTGFGKLVFFKSRSLMATYFSISL